MANKLVAFSERLDFWIKPIDFNLAESQVNDWQVFPLFTGIIGIFDKFSCHISSLKPNTIPHSPHSHIDDELIISLHGKIEILTSDEPADPFRDSLLLKPGSFVYHPPFQGHTIRGAGSQASRYLVLKWQRRYRQVAQDPHTFAHVAGLQDCTLQQVSDGFRLFPIIGLASHTDGSLHAHFSCLEPGAGYPAHRDNYDMVVVLLEGELVTLDISSSAPVVFFFAANTPHGFFNPSKKPATYLVFEYNKPKQN